LAKGMVLMIVSGGASVFQLPGLGWFSQIGVVATAFLSFFSVPPESAAACAGMLLLGCFLGNVAGGVILAQFENISLRKVAEESEQIEEEITAMHEHPAGESAS